MNPQFPIYIPSRSRHDSRLTARTFDMMGVPYHLVVDEDQYDDYAAVVPTAKLIVQDPRFDDEYETCDDRGDTKSKGPGPKRNFIWAHSLKRGFAWHWVIDDNIRDFHRLNRNKKMRCRDGTVLRCMEDFVLRYKNVGMAGPAYEMMTPDIYRWQPFVCNTRIYSCSLIRNDLPFRWRGRSNEDTILSLDMLKAGWCTIQFNAFLQSKIQTQVIKGGNTEAFYEKDGTLWKSQMLVDQHPDVARIMWRFGRWHHYVDYRPFKSMKLQRRRGLRVESGVNEYGMKVVKPPPAR